MLPKLREKTLALHCGALCDANVADVATAKTSIMIVMIPGVMMCTNEKDLIVW